LTHKKNLKPRAPEFTHTANIPHWLPFLREEGLLLSLLHRLGQKQAVSCWQIALFIALEQVMERPNSDHCQLGSKHQTIDRRSLLSRVKQDRGEASRVGAGSLIP
jgi:hypothetical protein